MVAYMRAWADRVVRSNWDRCGWNDGMVDWVWWDGELDSRCDCDRQELNGISNGFFFNSWFIFGYQGIGKCNKNWIWSPAEW